jgi:hypothetical protein
VPPIPLLPTESHQYPMGKTTDFIMPWLFVNPSFHYVVKDIIWL